MRVLFCFAVGLLMAMSLQCNGQAANSNNLLRQRRDVDFCYLPAYGRGVGTIPDSCPNGSERNGALCYPTCNDGFTGIGPVCWKSCSDGYKDDGALCRLDVDIIPKPSYGRGAGTGIDSCPSGFEKDDSLCYPLCDAGYTGDGPFCQQNCESGYQDDGLTCRRDVEIIEADTSNCPWYDVCGLALSRGCSTCPSSDYHNDGCTCRIDVSIYFKELIDRGVGTVMSCSPDKENDAGLCYETCDAGYVGKGPVCWGSCPPNYKDDGALCRKDAIIVPKESYGRSAGTVMSCKAGLEKDAGLCYESCRSQYAGIGPVCWGSCPSGYVACGAGCAVSSAACVNVIVQQVAATANVIFNIVEMIKSFGTSSTWSSGVQAASSNAEKAALTRTTGKALASVNKQMDQRLSSSELDSLTGKFVDAVTKGRAALSDFDVAGVALLIKAFSYPICTMDEPPGNTTVGPIDPSTSTPAPKTLTTTTTTQMATTPTTTTQPPKTKKTTAPTTTSTAASRTTTSTGPKTTTTTQPPKTKKTTAPTTTSTAAPQTTTSTGPETTTTTQPPKTKKTTAPTTTSTTAPQTTTTPSAFCYASSYPRVGGVLPSVCTNGTELMGTFCYLPCPQGFLAIGAVCWQICPSDSQDVGNSCQVDEATVPKPSYPRGPATPPDYCKSGNELSENKCYPVCRAGYTGIGATCYQDCPADYIDTGKLCTSPTSAVFAKHTESRNAGPKVSCSPGMDESGGLCYLPCNASYKAVDLVCSGTCPIGYAEKGQTCHRDAGVTPKSQVARGKGPNNPLCGTGQDSVGGYCYSPCVDDSFNAKGTLCVSKCPNNTVACGLACVTPESACPKIPLNQLTSNLPLASNVLSLVAAFAQNSSSVWATNVSVVLSSADSKDFTAALQDALQAALKAAKINFVKKNVTDDAALIAKGLLLGRLNWTSVLDPTTVTGMILAFNHSYCGSSLSAGLQPSGEGAADAAVDRSGSSPSAPATLIIAVGLVACVGLAIVVAVAVIKKKANTARRQRESACTLTWDNGDVSTVQAATATTTVLSL